MNTVFKKAISVLTLFSVFSATIWFGHSNTGQATDTKSFETMIKSGKSVIFLLPINHMLGGLKNITLRIKKPEHFKMIQEEFSPSFAEFIPENEDPNNWSKILTTSLFVGELIAAKPAVLDVINRVQGLTPQSDILEIKHHQFKNYEMSEGAIAYTNQNRKELMYVRAYAGPADYVSIQYTILIPEGKTAAEALLESKKFFDEVTEIIGDEVKQ